MNSLAWSGKSVIGLGKLPPRLQGGVSDRFLRSVAAFANTFGGLLIVGITEIDGRPDGLVGVPVQGEWKTKIASMIAAICFLVPNLKLQNVPCPLTPGEAICGQGPGNAGNLLTGKKGEPHPVYVRNEDQSVPADASQLRLYSNGKGRIKRLLRKSKLESYRIGTECTVTVGARHQSPDPE